MKKYSILFVLLFAVALTLSFSGSLLAGQGCCAGKSQSACAPTSYSGTATTMNANAVSKLTAAQSSSAAPILFAGASAMTGNVTGAAGAQASGECCGKVCTPCDPGDCRNGKSCNVGKSGEATRFGALLSASQVARIAL